MNTIEKLEIILKNKCKGESTIEHIQDFALSMHFPWLFDVDRTLEYLIMLCGLRENTLKNIYHLMEQGYGDLYIAMNDSIFGMYKDKMPEEIGGMKLTKIEEAIQEYTFFVNDRTLWTSSIFSIDENSQHSLTLGELSREDKGAQILACWIFDSFIGELKVFINQ